MFERYTEKARRAIFFARYEASQFGSAFIDTEHLLLGIAREDQALFKRLTAPEYDWDDYKGRDVKGWSSLFSTATPTRTIPRVCSMAWSLPTTRTRAGRR